MGYQVYEDPDHSWRWAGYAVPAECDWDGCDTRIDRGLAYKCEDHGDYVLMLDGEEISYAHFDDEPDAEEVWQERDGCGLYFCPDHKTRTGEHATVQPKPDSLEWEAHILSDHSWAPWREQHATRVGVMRARALHTAEATR
ncbi:hypothetical protein [Curtobacterium sp. MCLR17_044]|uniref:hypothetical protein n=1 Tax=Curtobacterium sp. MCLR17_044 TaxID=2175628 RepID=UPI000DA82D82|nr:hypothetical protein [Curtobacterium sp. MCLR17_044]PZE53733.1 hypothetical protein DEJ04_17460 [Curtobacterium sp. MCLR17_044]